MPLIRPETPADLPAIRRVNEAAFGRTVEADLVDGLRRAGGLTISLVAEEEGEVAGHIAFSPVVIEDGGRTHEGLSLSTMAVLPEHQRRGVGSRLSEAGLEACRGLGCGIVVVLGHPEYYPRFGFVPAARRGLRWEGGDAGEAFMAMELRPGALAGVRGVVRYRPEFPKVKI